MNFEIVRSADGKEIGKIDVRQVLDEIQINSVDVDESHRRKGVASDMMRELIERARELACTKITLEVREGNTAARKLYDKFGFEEVGKRENFYSNPADDAILMDKEI